MGGSQSIQATRGGARTGSRSPAFAPDCCDREAIGYVATSAGINAEDVSDLMVLSVEHRFGQAIKIAEPIELLTDNGSC